MSQTTSHKPKEHLDYLDSARGIAALMVLFYHFINWKYDSHTLAKVGSIIANGSDAVSFFFVLSGFVLSYKYVVLRQPLDIKKFYFNRFFRLPLPRPLVALRRDQNPFVQKWIIAPVRVFVMVEGWHLLTIFVGKPL